MKTVPRGLLVASAVLLLLLLTGGIWFFRTQEQLLRHQVDTQLENISRLKVDQIVQWRQEQLVDGHVIAENPFATINVAKWLAATNPAGTAQILAWFRSLQKYYQYADILLVDPEGMIRLSLSGQTGSLEAGAVATLVDAVRQRQPMLSDLHRLGDADLHLDTIAPIFAEGRQGVVGGVVLRIDPDNFLYPLIQSWPGLSESAETLLVRRDGEEVLFLNELRHQQQTALRLRIPLTKKEVPAVMAVTGVKGLVEGRDYRGIEVLSVLSGIPDTPWFMVTKINASEALAEWRARSLLIVGLFLGLGAAVITALGLAWQRQAKSYYKVAFRAEAERRQADARYRTTLMSIGDGVIACDSEGRVTMLNPVAEVLTGWLEADARGRTIEEVFVIVNESTRQPVENPVGRVLREGIVVGLANHTILITPEGAEFPIADSGAPIFDDQGRITGVVLVFRDQSEERKAAANLWRSNHLLVRAEEMANMGCWEFDFKTRTVWASPAARQIYGLRGETWTIEEAQFIPLPEYRHELNRALKALVQGEASYDVEFRILRPTDGRVLDIRSQAEYNPEEEKVFGVIRDITARKIAEASLLESESRYRSLFQNNHAVMWLVDAEDGSIVDANPAAVEYYGWSREQLLGMHLNDINTLSPEEIQVAMAKAMAARCHCFEFKHRRADGSIRDVEVFAGPIQVGGRPRLYSIVHDITERKQAEEQQERLQEQLMQAQKLESVGRLAGGVAHDLNNMLSPILGYSEVLLSELEDQDTRCDYVQYIIQAGMRARDLVRQLLAFGRKQTLVVETVDLNEVAAGFVQLLRRTIREDITIAVTPAPALPLVRVDAGQIEQVIMNLVVNAQDAMPDGGKIIIETGVMDLDEEYAASHVGVVAGRFVVMAVTDTGFGMDATVREQIFAPFFTTKEKGKGTGLGLAMAYGIVKQHGGNIWVYSEPGQGTTFKIYLPAVTSAQESKVKECAVLPDSRLGTATLMVVEDNDMVRQLTVDILSRRGYLVLEACGGAECLEMLSTHSGPLDLLVTDVVMPEMNGKMLYKQVVKNLPGLKVLYMSGYTENVIASRGVLDEGVNFIQKPFAPNSLAAKVREVLES
jgi:PAS domain S-box-containing protein